MARLSGCASTFVSGSVSVCVCVCVYACVDGASSEDASLGFVRSCGSVWNKLPRLSLALDVFDKSSEEHEARWRRTEQRAIAAARPAAPCTSNVLREAWCLRLLSLRSFTRDWWQDRQNRAPVHRQNSARISKLPPQPTHVALAALVW